MALDLRALVLLNPDQRDLIARYRCIGFDGYLIKPLRRASLAAPFWATDMSV